MILGEPVLFRFFSEHRKSKAQKSKVESRKSKVTKRNGRKKKKKKCTHTNRGRETGGNRVSRGNRVSSREVRLG